MPKFSLCTPITFGHEPNEKRMPRFDMFLRCANSVFGQTFQDFEWIIADDFANPPVEEVLEKHDSWWKPKGLQVKVVRLPEKSGRLVARNAAMVAATGEWLLWLDGDDELASVALGGLNDAIRVYPDFKVFNWNHLVFGYNYDVSVRRFLNMELQGDAPFGSGNIGAGAFMFHKSVYKDIGPLPEMGLWQFTEDFHAKHPETKPFFEAKDRPGQYHSLGNPWGCDYVYFYEMTRKYKSKYLDTAFYYVHSRFGHRWKDDREAEEKPGSKPEFDPNNQ